MGTGLGGGVVDSGNVIAGAAGMAGELGHVHIPMDGLLGPEQPVPRCNCGFHGDVESIASLTAIEHNLLPYWLTRFPDHELGKVADPAQAAKLTPVRLRRLRGHANPFRRKHAVSPGLAAQAVLGDCGWVQAHGSDKFLEHCWQRPAEFQLQNYPAR